MDLLIDCLRVAALVGWLGFLAVYSAYANWWETPIGRNVFGTGVLLAGVFGLVVLSSFYPEFLGRPYVQITVYAAGAFLGGQRAFHVIKAQREHRKDRRGATLPGVD